MKPFTNARFTATRLFYIYMFTIYLLMIGLFMVSCRVDQRPDFCLPKEPTHILLCSDPSIELEVYKNNFGNGYICSSQGGVVDILKGTKCILLPIPLSTN